MENDNEFDLAITGSEKEADRKMNQESLDASIYGFDTEMGCLMNRKEHLRRQMVNIDMEIMKCIIKMKENDYNS